VLSVRGLCDELITRPEESYRLCCVVVCDLETSRIVVYTYYLQLHGGGEGIRKVTGSIPAGVIGIFYWHNHSGRTTALELTQPLKEISTGISLGG
jgi:hypothetical protein